MFDFLNGPVRQLVTDMYEVVGYVGVAIWVAIESVIIPIPSELILPFAGFLVGEGTAIEPLTGQPWSLPLVVIAGTLGATGGGLVAYAIGYWGGRPIIARWGRILGVTMEDLDRMEAFFAKYGPAAALVGRLIPVVRSLVSFGAGVGKMPIVPFTVYTFLGSLPFTFLLVFVGQQLGANWEAIGAVLKQFEYVILGILIVIALVFLYVRLVRPRRRAAARPPG
ncbi:MAG TPA: DedA family protein [Candidatus Binatia bacterium]|nr:DedA family protein [Candidatus Binatia bacterium]